MLRQGLAFLFSWESPAALDWDDIGAGDLNGLEERDMTQRTTGQLVIRIEDRPMVNLADVTENPNDQGVFWELISKESNGASEFNVGVGRFEPGEVHPAHYHPDGAEFYLITSGRARLIIDGDVHEIGPGTAVYIPRSMPHGISNPYDEPVVMTYGFDRASFTDCGTVWVD